MGPISTKRRDSATNILITKAITTGPIVSCASFAGRCYRAAKQGGHVMKSILTMTWTAEDPSAFELAAKLAREFGARLVGLEPPSYGVMSMAWADAGMGAPIGGGLAEDAEERQ